MLNNKKAKSAYGYNGSENKLYLNIIVINGFVAINTFSTKIAHELKHLYQSIKTNRSKLNNNIYYLITKNRFIDEEGKEKNIIEKDIDIDVFSKVKNVVYLSSKYEGEAYVSELYNELCELNPKNYYEVLGSCNSYKAYINFVNDVSFIQDGNNVNEINYILSFYGLSYERFVKKAVLALDVFKRKIWKAVSFYIDNKQMYMEK